MNARHVFNRLSRGALYVVYLLVVLELATRLLLHIGPIFRTVVGRDDSSSGRLLWVRRHSEEGGFAAQYRFDVFDPMRGWAVMPNVRDLPVFDHRFLNTNSKGIRGTTEYTYDRDPARARILTFGDSYTFGDEVSDNETYSYFLSQEMPEAEVLNLGVHGYGHDQMLLYLQHEGVKYRPDVVIVGFVWFDINRNLVTFSNYSKPRFVLDDGSLRLTNTPVPEPQVLLDREIYRSKLFDLGVIFSDRMRTRLGVNRRRAEAITQAIFDELVKTARQINAVPVLVYLPVLDEILNQDPALTVNEKFLLSYCQERQVGCLFLRDRFLEEQRNGVTFNTRSHWFANGHRTAAKRITEYLREHNLVGGARGSSQGSSAAIDLR